MNYRIFYAIFINNETHFFRTVSVLLLFLNKNGFSLFFPTRSFGKILENKGRRNNIKYFYMHIIKAAKCSALPLMHFLAFLHSHEFIFGYLEKCNDFHIHISLHRNPPNSSSNSIFGFRIFAFRLFVHICVWSMGNGTYFCVSFQFLLFLHSIIIRR